MDPIPEVTAGGGWTLKKTEDPDSQYAVAPRYLWQLYNIAHHNIG